MQMLMTKEEIKLAQKIAANAKNPALTRDQQIVLMTTSQARHNKMINRRKTMS